MLLGTAVFPATAADDTLKSGNKNELDQAGSDSFDDIFIVSLGTLVNF